MPQLKVEVYESFESLGPLHRAALSYPSVQDFSLSLQWFEALYCHGLTTPGRLRLYLVLDGDRALACLYCLAVDGRRLLGLTNFYTVRFDLVRLGGDVNCENAARCLIAKLVQERPRWATIEFRYFRERDSALDPIAGHLRANGFAVEKFFQYANWFEDVESSDFDSYWSQRPSQLRNTVKRRAKKLGQSGAIAIHIHRSHGARLDDAIARYMEVYQSSWKRREARPEFIENVMRRAASEGVLRLGELLVDGVPAASQFWIVSSGEALIYKLAYDERFQHLSVGSILSTEMFRQAIEADQVCRIDYGIGDESYKHDWMSARGRISGLEAHDPRTILGASRLWVARSRQFAKRVVRRRQAESVVESQT